MAISSAGHSPLVTMSDLWLLYLLSTSQSFLPTSLSLQAVLHSLPVFTVSGNCILSFSEVEVLFLTNSVQITAPHAESSVLSFFKLLMQRLLNRLLHFFLRLLFLSRWLRFSLPALKWFPLHPLEIPSLLQFIPCGHTGFEKPANVHLFLKTCVIFRAEHTCVASQVQISEGWFCCFAALELESRALHMPSKLLPLSYAQHLRAFLS